MFSFVVLPSGMETLLITSNLNEACSYFINDIARVNSVIKVAGEVIIAPIKRVCRMHFEHNLDTLLDDVLHTLFVINVTE